VGRDPRATTARQPSTLLFAASGICFDGHIPLCPENVNPDLVVMKLAQNQERFEG
jgi:hypothetical protein